jgi:hypothetical protein
LIKVKFGQLTSSIMGKSPNHNEYPRPKGWGSRHTLSVMLFLAFTIHQTMRVNISVAIVAMVKQGKIVETYVYVHKYTNISFKINCKIGNDSSNRALGYECSFPETWKEQSSNVSI